MNPGLTGPVFPLCISHFLGWVWVRQVEENHKGPVVAYPSHLGFTWNWNPWIGLSLGLTFLLTLNLSRFQKGPILGWLGKDQPASYSPLYIIHYTKCFFINLTIFPEICWTHYPSTFFLFSNSHIFHVTLIIVPC